MIFTIGHGTLSAEAFATLTGQAGIDEVIDIRRYPGSRHHPHVSSEEMARWLPDAGIGYRWIVALGGRRALASNSPNVGLRNLQFRAYADHMATVEFIDAVHELRVVADLASTAVMCSEAVWWRCHRRLLADYLVLVEGTAVRHLFHDGRLQDHPVTPGARRADGRVLYAGAND